MSVNELVKPEHQGAFMDALLECFEAKVNGESVDREKQVRVNARIQAFMNLPETQATAQKAKLQAFMTKSDLPDIITNMPDFITQVNNYDMGWQLAFKERTLDQGRFEWEIVTTTNGIAWRLMAEGERASVEGITGAVIYGKCNRYSAAVGWTDEMVRGRRLGTMIDLAAEVRNSYFVDKANRYYGLLRSAKTGTATAYDTTGSTVLDKDINVLNSAYVTMGNALKNKGYGDTANAPVLLYAKPNLKARIIRALTNTTQDVPGQPARVVYNINPIFTWNSNFIESDNHALMVLPGQKIQRATAVDMVVMGRVDELSNTYIQAFHSYHGACVADGEQIAVVKFA